MATIKNALAVSLAAELGVKSAQTTYIARVEDIIDDVYKGILSSKDWFFARNTQEILTTVAHQAQYNLTASADQLVSCRIPLTEQKVHYTTIQELIDSGTDIELEGTTDRYFYAGFDEGVSIADVGGTVVQLWPVPATSGIILHFVVEKRGLTIATTAPIPLPPDFLPLLKDGVREVLYQLAGKLPDSQFYQQRYMAKLATLMAKNQFPAHRLQLSYTDLPHRTGFIGPKLDPQHFNNN